MKTQKNLPDKFFRVIKDIPAIPDIVVKVMQMTRDPKISAQQLTDMISNDPGLTGNILRLCNSAYYGIPRVVSSLHQAVMYLGFHTIRSLVLTCSFGRLFGSMQPIYGYTPQGIWYHSVACAITGELLCKHVKPELHDIAFTAGLLHDVGQIILGISIKDTSDTIIDLMVNGQMPELSAEQEAVGFTHQELGAHLADMWNFPDDLIHSMLYHHNPQDSKSQAEMTAIVHIADTLTLDLGFGIELEQMKYPMNPLALQLFKKDQEWLNGFREQARAVVEEKASHFLEILA